jgi:hypothetical protein
VSGSGRRWILDASTFAIAAHISEAVLATLAVRQWVFSLPKRLRPFLPHDPPLTCAALRVLLSVSGPCCAPASGTPAHGQPKRAPTWEICRLSRFVIPLETGHRTVRAEWSGMEMSGSTRLSCAHATSHRPASKLGDPAHPIAGSQPGAYSRPHSLAASASSRIRPRSGSIFSARPVR